VVREVRGDLGQGEEKEQEVTIDELLARIKSLEAERDKLRVELELAHAEAKKVAEFANATFLREQDLIEKYQELRKGYYDRLVSLRVMSREGCGWRFAMTPLEVRLIHDHEKKDF